MVKEAVAEVILAACQVVNMSTGMHKEEEYDVIGDKDHNLLSTMMEARHCTGVVSFPFQVNFMIFLLLCSIRVGWLVICSASCFIY